MPNNNFLTTSESTTNTVKIHVQHHTNDSRKNAFTIRVSMVNFLAGNQVSKKNQIKGKINAESTTKNIADYIKPIVWKNQIILIDHSGTKSLTSGINTIAKVRKTVAAAKEIDKERSIKLTFSGIVNRNYVNQTKEIATINGTLH